MFGLAFVVRDLVVLAASFEFRSRLVTLLLLFHFLLYVFILH